MAYIEVDNLSFQYSEEKHALNKVSFTINKGEKVVILGANGSGKSTLIQHFNGILYPEEGYVCIDGARVSKKNILAIRKKIGIVFDNPDDQIVASTVAEDVAFGPRNMGLAEDEVEKRVSESLKAVGIYHLKDEYPFNLSFGQKKKVVIGGVLAMKPEIIVLDEPFAGLDILSNNNMLDIFKELQKQGHTLIIATHDVDIAYQWGEKFLLLFSGEVLKEGGREVFTNKMLLNKASLACPTLVKVFEDTGISVKDAEMANKIIKERLR